jgi:hypothetical protein
MLWSVTYNAYLAWWGSSLKKDAVVAWDDDFAEDFDSAKDASGDIQKMIANTPDFEATADGYFC